jgi:hypothetical protein
VAAKRVFGRDVNFRGWLHPVSGDMHVAETLAISAAGRPWGRNRLRLFRLASARLFAKPAVLRGLRGGAAHRLLPRHNSIAQRHGRVLRSAMCRANVRPKLLVAFHLISPLHFFD